MGWFGELYPWRRDRQMRVRCFFAAGSWHSPAVIQGFFPWLLSTGYENKGILYKMRCNKKSSKNSLTLAKWNAEYTLKGWHTNWRDVDFPLWFAEEDRGGVGGWMKIQERKFRCVLELLFDSDEIYVHHHINWIHNIVMVVAVVMMMMTTPTTTMMMMMMKPVLHVLVYHIYSICICYCQIIYLIAFEFIELPLKKYSRHPSNHWLLKRWTSSMASHFAQVFKNYFALSQAHSPRSGFLKIHVGKLLNNSKVPQRHGVWKADIDDIFKDGFSLEGSQRFSCTRSWSRDKAMRMSENEGRVLGFVEYCFCFLWDTFRLWSSLAVSSCCIPHHTLIIPLLSPTSVRPWSQDMYRMLSFKLTRCSHFGASPSPYWHLFQQLLPGFKVSTVPRKSAEATWHHHHHHHHHRPNLSDVRCIFLKGWHAVVGSTLLIQVGRSVLLFST